MIRKETTSAVLLFLWAVLAYVTPIWDIGNFALIGFGVVTVLALVIKDWPLFYLSLTFLFMSLYWVVVPSSIAGLPVLPVLLPAVLSSLVLFFAHRSELSWIRRGKIDRVSAMFIVATGIGSTAALILWANWTDTFGVSEQMVKGFATVPFWLIALVGIPIFSCLNALAEEVVYRGIMQEVLYRKFGSWILILLIQAVTFAALHYAMGFPNGKIGFAMVFVYGLALGFLRHRTDGMLAPYLAHVLADLTIGYFLIFKFL